MPRRTCVSSCPGFRKGLGGIVGLITGAVQGAFFGIMAVAFIGAVLGGIVGLLLRRLFRGKKWLVLHVFPRACCSPQPVAWQPRRSTWTVPRRPTGLLVWELDRAGSGLFLCLVALPLAFLTVRRPVTVRLAESKIKEAILHPEEEVRLKAALLFLPFSQSGRDRHAAGH